MHSVATQIDEYQETLARVLQMEEEISRLRSENSLLRSRLQMQEAGKLDEHTESALNRFLAIIKERYDVDSAILYGSRARGTHHEYSDADLAVILRGTPQKRLTVTLDMGETAYDIMLETRLLISPFPIWLQEWEHPEESSCNPALILAMKRDGIFLPVIHDQRPPGALVWPAPRGED